MITQCNHDILKEKLKKRVKDPQIFNLLCIYIDSTDGLPLGYQTSQLLALMYLDDFDHWVKETLHARYYMWLRMKKSVETGKPVCSKPRPWKK